jgi:lipopolysaccharide/colanic/teichoic acid biosynthesis glycosyltransferase
MMKRFVDVVVSLTGLLMLSPVLLMTAVLVKLTSRGPVLFRQQRVGLRFRPFFIYKFRSMVPDAPKRGAAITFGDDPRITRVGRILRKTKIDELPQLFNVFRGDMSLVGPRPEVPRYVEMFRQDYEEILRVRPGITDLASIEYCDEATILGNAENPEEEYVRRVLPEKIRLAKEYVRRSSLALDFSIIIKTVAAICPVRVGARGRKDNRVSCNSEHKSQEDETCP